VNAFKHDYGSVDKLLHRLAFRGAWVQRAVADIEDALFRRVLSTVPIKRPVFITSLPRCGTTLLLQMLAETGSFATHTYADMPFVLCPLLWHHLTRRFRISTDGMRERAHGDGVQVGFRSPESFEEVVWRAHWPEMYSGNSIRVWSSRQSPETFTAFFRSHLRKVILLHRGSAGLPRYVSKNNMNIVRLTLLATMFPDSILLVPFRNPLDHCVSLLRQHENFRALQQRDKFVGEYMRYTGHFEFGAELAPIDFDGWLEAECPLRANELSFWVRYWCAAFEHVLHNRPPNVVLLDYDRMCDDPQGALRMLADCLPLQEDSLLLRQAARIRPATRHERSHAGALGEAGARAFDMYTQLRSSAINRD
jgi:hypothetical protein